MDFRWAMWYYNANKTKDVVPMRQGWSTVKK